MTQNKRHIHFLILLVMFILTSRMTYAQTYDYPSMSALISDHKTIRASMIIRNSIEHANELLHEQSAETNTHYEAIGDSLDKYNRFFNLIDVIYSSCMTVFHIKNTYDDLSSKLSDFVQLNETFIQFCTEKKSVTASDSIILSCYDHIYKTMKSDLNGLYVSFSDLVAYASGAASCTTAHLMSIFNNINYHLDHMNDIIQSEYYILWKYIRIRTTFWKPELYRYQWKDRATICNESLQRWQAARKSLLSGK